jgi:Mn-containing catalase
MNSGGAPWSAGYIDTIGEPTADLRSNIAAESRAKIIYERLMNVTPDPSVQDALGFLMTREIAHQKSFEKALYAIEPNFPPGKRPGNPDFTDKYYDLSQGEGEIKGAWNSGGTWEVVKDRKKQSAVDGGDGTASVQLSKQDQKLLKTAADRTQSRATLRLSSM